MSSYGLTHSQELLSQLPVLQSRPRPHAPIRILSAAQFSAIHLNHLLAHAPDNVLFPFLHGLEGSNDAQNLFFANNTYKSGHTSRDVHVPKYRGLVWVVCDDDLDHETSSSAEDEDDDLDDESFSDGSSSYLVDSDRFAMDVDPERDNATDGHIHHPNELVPDSSKDHHAVPAPVDYSNHQPHMHPISHRSQVPVQAVPVIHTSSITANTTTTISDAHARRDSTTSSICSTSTSADSFSMSTSLFASSISSPATSIASSNPPDKLSPPILPSSLSPPSLPSSPPPLSPSPAPVQSHSAAPPPLFTSTFFARDLLRTSSEGEPEFVPPKLPSGISLRNFGIQVPIYATISDIVVYSPKGLTPTSIALAEKFKAAVERKASERLARSRKRPISFSDSMGDGNSMGFEREERDELEENGLLAYNVFVLSATAEEMHESLPHLIIRHTDSPSSCAPTTTDTTFPSLPPNTVDFAQREKDEMRDLTQSSEIISVYSSKEAEQQARAQAKAEGKDMSRTSTYWNPHIGQVFLGNSNDVPLAVEMMPSTSISFDYAGTTSGLDTHLVNNTDSGFLKDEYKDRERKHAPSVLSDSDPFNYTTNDPQNGYGYDICIECTDLAPFPSAAHLRAAEEHLQMLDAAWAERCRPQRRWSLSTGRADNGSRHMSGVEELPVRPPPNANAVIHLPFPSSPLPCGLSMNALVPVVKFLERVLQVPQPSTPPISRSPASPPPQPPLSPNSRRWSSSVSSLLPSIQMAISSSYPSSTPPPPSGHYRTRSFTSPHSNPHHSSRISAGSNSPGALRTPAHTQIHRSRPLKILIYSSDGYTESSVPALCLLMAVRRLSLPEAYLELQVVKKRSFFVYQGDLGTLRRVESRLCGTTGNAGSAGVERGNRDVGCGVRMQNPYKRPAANSVSSSQSPILQPYSDYQFQSHFDSQSHAPVYSHPHSHSESDSGSELSLPPPTIVPSQHGLVKSRPRASTSPWLPSLFADHQAWFDDPRFDGSFPSRVLPFLYLGNLNHASNAYMLHALGITHVVSVGECALVPPPHINMSVSGSGTSSSPGPHFIAGKGPGHQGSLWIEEREGRIKVLDIKGVCDDGIDTLEPQLEPICAWIERARLEGGQVLVHCRVGVSRSATVTIAYVMKHLGRPLVDAYLIVRSRRLSVLIQPNMRLLYNLCGWEVKLARERAGDDEEKLKLELSRALSWPYLAKEVHALNEKYLH